MIKMEILSASVPFKTVRQNYVSRGSSQADLTCFFTNLFYSTWFCSGKQKSLSFLSSLDKLQSCF